MDEAIRKALHFSWVVGDEVAGMAFPPLDAWPVLKDEGVGAVLTLTERLPLADMARSGLAWRHLPIRDFGVPADDALDQAIGWMQEEVRGGRPVAVHCGAGMGRTGLVLAAYLVARGLAPGDAIREIRRTRPGSVETREQAAAVEAYAARRRERSQETEGA